MERWNLHEYHEYLKTGKPANKYHAKESVFKGVKYDSQREAEFAECLDLLAKIGEVSDVKIQVPYKIEINGQLICRYVADFVVTYSDNRVEVIDVKSPYTAKLPVYRLKKKLMKAVLGIEIKEVM